MKRSCQDKKAAVRRKTYPYMLRLLLILPASLFLACSSDQSPTAPSGKVTDGGMTGLLDGTFTSSGGRKKEEETKVKVIKVTEELPPPRSASPRLVRVIYFVPSDQVYSLKMIQGIKEDMHRAQSFFAEQMQAHGYGAATFQFETDDQGNLLIYHVEGQYPVSHYVVGEWLQYKHYIELEQVFDFHQNIYATYLNRGQIGDSSSFGGRLWKESGTIDMYRHPDYSNWDTLAHELGHAFGLPHDFRDGAYLMSYGEVSQFSGTGDRLSTCAATFLSAHPYFKEDSVVSGLYETYLKQLNERESVPQDPAYIEPPDSPPLAVPDVSSPTINVLSPSNYTPNKYGYNRPGTATFPSGLDEISLRFRITDIDGLHQVLIEATPRGGGGGLRACHSFDGKKNAIVEFNYDGSREFADPDGRATTLEDTPHSIVLYAVDVKGNMKILYIELGDYPL